MNLIEILKDVKNEKFLSKNLMLFLFLLKTLIVGTCWNSLVEAVLISTHNSLCFEANIRKIVCLCSEP